MLRSFVRLMTRHECKWLNECKWLTPSMATLSNHVWNQSVQASCGVDRQAGCHVSLVVKLGEGGECHTKSHQCARSQGAVLAAARSSTCGRGGRASKAGKPCAELIPLEKSKRKHGSIKGHLDDGFSEPLPEAELSAWVGR